MATIEIPTALSAWTTDAVLKLLEAGVNEDTRLDWKQTARGEEQKDRFLKSAVGMANRAGGFLVLGVSDDRTRPPVERLVGVERMWDATNEVPQKLRRADPPVPHRFLQPPLSIPKLSDRVLHVIEIHAGLGPHSVDGVFYGRTGSSTPPLKTEEVRALFIQAEEMRLKLRHLMVELAAVRTAALTLEVVDNEMELHRLRLIDTATLSQLHAAVLPLLRDAPDLSDALFEVRGRSAALNLSLQTAMPLLYQTKAANPYSDVKMSVLLWPKSRAGELARKIEWFVPEMSKRLGVPAPELIERVKLQSNSSIW